MTARGTATNKLMNVIQMLQMACKTGTLLVNRDGMDNTIEQGALSLQHGQIIDASLSPYRGVEALQRLQGWQSCYFVFQALSQHSSGSLPSIQMSLVTPNLSAGYHNGTTPMHSIPGGGNVPQRVREINNMLPRFNQLGLTRMHRQLFLLIDGHRTVPELIRLMGHRTDEVDTLLGDLERAGLVRW
jgi:hypothetical protein